MSDAQLLDRFLARRDDAAEAAFEEMVIRHGPMVLRVCRGVLRDAHAAEDALQAVFLVLANRASFVRGSTDAAAPLNLSILLIAAFPIAYRPSSFLGFLDQYTNTTSLLGPSYRK